MAEPATEYPTIDPPTFDLIISGTGLPQSLLAAAASLAGKSVLHVDPNPFYGHHFSSLPLPSFPSFLSSCHVYSHIQTSGSLPEASRSFSIDLTGVRLLYCADETVDLLLRSGANHHVEFKSVDLSLVYWEKNLCSVPDSRQAIFKDKTLGLVEKSQMMKFLKIVQSHIEKDGLKISEEDLELPFVEFLKKQKLPIKIRAIVLYAICMADYDQEDGKCEKLVTTREGIERISLYTKSMGRFANAIGAFIYPMYGQGELPQAFCRCAAVKGALYVLRMPVTQVLIDEENDGKYKGVKLASGQEIYSPNLVLEPSYKLQNSFLSHCESSNMWNYVARGVCITSSSIQLGSSNILVVFPPKSLNEEQVTAVRALQLSSNVAVCPSGLFVVHLSTPCQDANLGKEIINSAIKALFVDNNSSDSNIEEPTNNEGDTKPTLLWSCVFVQELVEGSFGSVSVCPMPDENLDYRNIVNTTKKLFESMYPGEEFLPLDSTKDNINDDYED